MPDPQERHYSINKLNFLFAISSLILLGTLVWMFMADYTREWKVYQKEFRALEMEKTRVKLDVEKNKLEDLPEYQDLVAQLDAAKKMVAEKCSGMTEVKKEIRQLQAENDLLTHNTKIQSAQLDAARFRYEEAVDKKHALEHVQKEYLALRHKVAELKIAVENSDKKLDAKSAIIKNCENEYKELAKQESSFTKQADIFQRKLDRIDPGEMGVIDLVADAVRDMPVIDFANPNYKIEQIVLKDIHDDVNFMKVPKVDRCISCHMGIANPDYKDAPQPFRAHPNLELYLATNSPHPMEEFGCTTCHGGRGRGTSFNNAVHTPSSEHQREEWEEKYGWQEFHLWEEPMLPLPYVEAGCFKCHVGETTMKGAEKLNLGLQIIEKAGCYACHVIDKYKEWPKPGPDLTHIAAKSNPEWVYQWINDPKSFRHNTWMPAFFNQSNNSDPASMARSEQEIHAIVHYLFAQSAEFKLNDMPNWGDAKRGEQIVSSIGCFGCHNVQKEPIMSPRTNESLRREHGPNLIGLGAKTNKEWIYTWLKNPDRYHPETRMPNLRLTDQEAADAAAYLSSDKGFSGNPAPAINAMILNDIVRSFLMKTNTMAQADSKIGAMDTDGKLFYAGQKLIGQYGCYSCHNIAGFENYKPIGTELTEEGSKSVHKLDFGFIDLEHTRQAWFKQKLMEPRIFDRDKVRAPDEKLRMPNYDFTEAEADAVTTALLGFVKDRPEPSKIKPRTPENLYVEEGQELIRQFNCQGCHIIEGEGGAIQSSITQWLIDFEGKGKSDAEAMTPSFSPPNLIGEGKKVHSEWLFEFLHQPTEIRPWLKARMPTYTFNAAHLNVLLKYFNALDEEPFPFTDMVDTSLTPEEFEAGKKLFSNDYFACAKCHIVGDTMPAGSPDSWAPNFALAKKRLKPRWISEWMFNPQDLLPGTKMPTFFDPDNFDISGPEDVLDGDEHRQIEVLRNYILTLTNGSADTMSAAKPAPVKAPESEPAE